MRQANQFTFIFFCVVSDICLRRRLISFMEKREFTSQSGTNFEFQEVK